MTKHPTPSTTKPQADDQKREEQRSHGDQQHRSKKEGHTSQVGSSQDQVSQRNRGEGSRKPG